MTISNIFSVVYPFPTPQEISFKYMIVKGRLEMNPPWIVQIKRVQQQGIYICGYKDECLCN